MFKSCRRLTVTEIEGKKSSAEIATVLYITTLKDPESTR